MTNLIKEHGPEKNNLLVNRVLDAFSDELGAKHIKAINEKMSVADIASILSILSSISVTKSNLNGSEDSKGYARLGLLKSVLDKIVDAYENKSTGTASYFGDGSGEIRDWTDTIIDLFGLTYESELEILKDKKLMNESRMAFGKTETAILVGISSIVSAINGTINK